MTAPADTRAPFDAGRVYFIRITPLDGHAGVVDHDTNTVEIDPEWAADPNAVAELIRSAWRAIGDEQRPKLTVVKGGGRRTKRRGNLRLVGA